MATRGSLPFLTLSALVALSCGSSGEGAAFGAGTRTLVTVEPEAFRGDVVCGDHPGAMRAYVATLTDISTSPPFQLASSGPVPCQAAVSFAYVVPGHGYLATIEAYDRDDLTPLGGSSSGSPSMLDPASGEAVSPTWTSRCELGQGADIRAAAVSQPSRDVRVRGCSPLLRTEEAKESRISFALSSGALGGLVCGDGKGQVERYAVAPEGSDIARQEAACDEPLVFEAEPGRLQGFTLHAFEAGSTEPRWTSRCQATARAGTTLPASCTPLSSLGSIRLRVGDLLAARGRSCAPSDIERYDVLLNGKVVVTGAPCDRDAIASALEPGSYSLGFVGFGRSDHHLDATLVVRCPAVEVASGARVETTCSP